MKVKGPLLILPPPGPLSWLFPGLVTLEQELRSRFNDPGATFLSLRVRDLSTHPFPGSSLAEDLLAGGWEQIILPDCPRGQSLRNQLLPALRSQGRSIQLDAAAARRFTLEGLLTQTCARARSGEVVEVRAAAAGTVQHMLPLHPGSDTEGNMEAALARATIARAQGVATIPVFLTAPPDKGPWSDAPLVETRLAPSWWGVLPGDRYPASVRQATRSLQQILAPKNHHRFLAYESLALAGVDLYGEAVAGRQLKSPRPPSQALIIGVEGIDGAGKTSHASAIRSFLDSRGLRTAIHKIYRHGVFHDTVTDVTRLCAGGRNLHLWRLQRLAKALDSAKYCHSTLDKDFSNLDALVFDRYTYTHRAAGVGRYQHDPWTREILSLYPTEDRLYLLDLPVECALERLSQRKDRTVDETPYMLGRYRHALLDMATEAGMVVLDGRASFEENQRLIEKDLASLLATRDAGLCS